MTLRTCLLFILFSGSFATLSAQNPNPGYANVDNNLNKIPKVFVGITPLAAEYRQGISFRPGIHLNIRGERFGELQLNGTYTPDALVDVPKQPFGPTYRCNCAENNMTAFTGADLSYTYYLFKREPVKNYRMKLQAPKLSAEAPYYSKGITEKLQGKVQHLYGLRLGAAYQKGSFYLLNSKRTLAYSGFEQQLAFVGFSRTNIGRMYRNYDDYGITGKNIHSQLYADVFYAFNQDFDVEAIALYDSQGRLRKNDPVAVPYGFRVGATAYNYGFRSRAAIYTNIEAGIRPTFEDLANGLYIGVKIGVGFGFGKTRVYYISNGQNTSPNGKAANIEGNGKYRDRGFIGRIFKPYRPLKMVRHRYGK
ncbi:MAG: hypothetical protein V4616_06995 [Bacteroidota bacterium]